MSPRDGISVFASRHAYSIAGRRETGQRIIHNDDQLRKIPPTQCDASDMPPMLKGEPGNVRRHSRQVIAESDTDGQ